MKTKVYGYGMLCLLVMAVCAMEINASCQDKLSNCGTYPDSSCKAPYKAWALANCRKRCNLCSATPPGHGNCHDKILTCDDHVVVSDICRVSTYKQWARDKCAMTCGLCSPVDNGSCQDKLANCGTYADFSCKAPYKAWALANCRKRCNLCGATPPGHGNCHDKILTCDDHVAVSNICQVSTYKQFAKDNCAMTCGFCSPIGKQAIDFCTDNFSNCLAYPDSACAPKNAMWAMVNCRKRCGLCSDKPTKCEDSPECSAVMGKNMFCHGYYRNWVAKYCPVRCNLCTPGGTTLKPLSTEVKTTTASSKGSCKDKRADCSKYLESSCKAPYKGWAFDNCRKRCNLCEATPPGQGNCRDKIVNCEDHVILSDACRAKNFKQWAKEKCAMTCGFCTPTGELTPTIPVDKLSG